MGARKYRGEMIGCGCAIWGDRLEGYGVPDYQTRVKWYLSRVEWNNYLAKENVLSKLTKAERLARVYASQERRNLPLPG
jgi:hypothetical protein